MPKYLSGRSKRRSQDKLTEDRYQYLAVDQTEPNLGDPPETFTIPAGETQYQIISVVSRPGERFWKPIGGGTIPAAHTVRSEGLVVPRTNADPNLGINSITDVNFVGVAVTVVGFIKPDGDAGSAVTVTISPPGNDNEILFNNNGEFATSSLFKFDNSTVGVASVGIGTTQPTQNLHVAGNFRLEGIFFDEDNDAGTPSQLLVKTSDGGLKYTNANAVQSGAGGEEGQIQYHGSTGLVEGADNFYYLENEKRVGIGSTQPDRLLDVLGDSRFTGFTTFVGVTTFTDDVTFLTSNSKNIFFDKSSDSLTFGEDVEARFGSGSNGDGLIYHDSSDFYINSKIGDLNLKVNFDTAIKAKQNSGVELYFDDQKRLETVGGGVTVIGDFSVSGISTFAKRVAIQSHLDMPNDAKIRLGLNDDLVIFQEGDTGDAVIKEVGIGSLRIEGSDIIFKSVGAPVKKYAEFKDGGEIKLYHNNLEKFQTTGIGVSVIGLTSTTDLNVTGVVTSNLIPGVDEYFDIGQDNSVSGNKRWNKIYAKEFIGQIQVTQASFTVQNLKVTGISTFIGIATFGGGIVVESGVSTFRDPVGILTDLVVTGISTFSGLTTVTSTDHALHTKKLSVSGVSTFFDTVNVKTSGGSVIQDASGTLDLRSNLISLENNSGVATFARFSNGGSAELWYNNNKTFETVSLGATVPGTFFTNQLDVVGFSTFRNTILVEEQKRIRFADSNRRIFADGTDLNVNASAASNLNLKACADGVSSGKINIVNVGSGVTINPAGSVDIYHSPNKRLSTTGIGITVLGNTETQTLNVTGVSTLSGITTQKSTLFSTKLSVSGVSTFFDTINVNTPGSSTIQDASGILNIQANTINLKDQTNTSVHLTALANDKVELYYANAAKLATNPSGISVTGSLITSAGVSTIGGHVYPSQNEQYNLGKDSTLRWNKVYAKEYYGIFKGSIGPNIPVDRADTVKITDDTTVAGLHYIHFGDDATTDNYDAVEVDSTGLKYQDKVLVVNKISSGISTIGFATATDLIVGSASTFAGLTTVTSTDHAFHTKDLSVAGVSSFFNTVNVKTAGGSVIQDASGTLDIRANILSLENNAGVATFARFSNGGSAELWYNNVNRLQTTGYGVTIFKELQVENINASGVVTATDFNSTSDAKLKTNIQVIDNPIEKIMKIDGVSFNWKATNKPSFGVIADNVQETLPDLVNNEDPKTVNYNGLVGLLIEVVKNQQEQINELRGLLDK